MHSAKYASEIAGGRASQSMEVENSELSVRIQWDLS